MNVLILGDGAEELAWARWLSTQPEHRLDAAFPGFDEPSLSGLPSPADLDDALARPGIEAVVVGGPLETRGEWLRRAAAEGLAIIALHPPGPDSEAYYQVSLSREETGAVIVPDLPMRLHPGVAAMRRAIDSGELGSFRSLRLEASPAASGSGLVRVEFARVVDAVRAILGDIEAVTATGDPPGMDPELELVVQLRASEARRAEVRLRPEATPSLRLSLIGSVGSMELAVATPGLIDARLIQLRGTQPAGPVDLPHWDRHEAIMAVLAASIGRRDPASPPRPDLLDGTRAMELSEAVNRSLRRGRTVEMNYEAISEENTFKSVMTSTGCLILMISLFLLPIAMVGPAIGLNWTLYLPVIILPALILFFLLQGLRLAIRKPTAQAGTQSRAGDGSADEVL